MEVASLNPIDETMHTLCCRIVFMSITLQGSELHYPAVEKEDTAIMATWVSFLQLYHAVPPRKRDCWSRHTDPCYLRTHDQLFINYVFISYAIQESHAYYIVWVLRTLHIQRMMSRNGASYTYLSLYCRYISPFELNKT